MDHLKFTKMQEYMIEEYVDIFIDTFTKGSWNDVYESREQVVNFFHNHMSGDRFLGYVAKYISKVWKPFIYGRFQTFVFCNCQT